MKKIENMEQLAEQRLLTRMRVRELEEQIKKEYTEIKNDLTPMNIAGKAIKDMLTSQHTGVVNASIGITIDTLIKNLIFRKSNFITKAIVSFVAKNYARNLVSENSESILNWVQMLLPKLKSKHHQNGNHYDESTVGVDW